MISRLSGTDSGPTGNWEKKVISSSSNKMLVEFKSDMRHEDSGFATSIQFIQSQSQECKSLLNMTSKTLQSSNYPNSHDNNISCNWLITVKEDFHIILQFLEFDVSISII